MNARRKKLIALAALGLAWGRTPTVAIHHGKNRFVFPSQMYRDRQQELRQRPITARLFMFN